MMELQILASLTYTLQGLTVGTIILAVCAYIPTLKYRAQLAKLPALGGEGSAEKQRQSYLTSAKQLYTEGYRKFKNVVYHVKSSDGEDSIVVPPSLFAEFRKLPDDVLSFSRSIEQTMEVKYTGIETEAKFGVHAIKSDLTPALNRLNPILGDEVDAAIDRYLPPCDDWTEVNINAKLVDIVAKVSGRIFVGPELSNDPEYLHCGTNYTVYVMQAVTAIKTIRPILKPFLAPRLPEIRRLRDLEKRATAFLKPIIRARMDAKKDRKDEQEPDDMMEWLFNRQIQEHNGSVSVEKFTKIQLALIFAAIHTTTMTTTNILYTLAVTPEYVEPLREEMRTVIAQNDGKITSRALQQMEKLDSYMKEVMRVYPPSATSFSRRVLKPITLSNGQYIPANTMLEFPSYAIYSDPALYPNSATFDGFRHYKLRRGSEATGSNPNGSNTTASSAPGSTSAANHARNQFVTTNETNLAWGYGRHACPGRFFATNEIKMILVRLVLGWDIKMPEGAVGGGVGGRYKQFEMGRMTVPDPTKVLVFRKVKV